MGGHAALTSDEDEGGEGEEGEEGEESGAPEGAAGGGVWRGGR